MTTITRRLLPILLVTLIAACAPSEAAIQAAIQETAAAMPTPTRIHIPKPTNTPQPTITPHPIAALYGTWNGEYGVNMILQTDGHAVLMQDETITRITWRVMSGKLCFDYGDETRCHKYIQDYDDLTVISGENEIDYRRVELIAANTRSRETAMPAPHPAATRRSDTPVGGWDTDDGRAIVLAENGNFVVYFTDNTSMSGTWKLTGNQLCLKGDIGTNNCFSYSQNGNRMTLGDAVYYRR